jgi:trimeric autotransporter adhesin
MSILVVVSGSSRQKPNAPTIGTATNVGTGRAYNNGAATVTFTAPTYDGRSAITSYTVTSSPGGFTASGASSPLTVTGLQSSTSYTFTVTATNAIGTSAASSASNSITATTVPQAPTIGTATGGNASATVAYTANATGEVRLFPLTQQLHLLVA